MLGSEKTSLDGNLIEVNDGKWAKPTAIGLEVCESMRKRIAAACVAREDVERGTEVEIARENVWLRKRVVILVLYGAGVEIGRAHV